ncbi:hypothetical protein RSOL_359440 [Rhizoctonia solani AG-3 Rhs1AP]|uniref:Secreted protein n=2 Tax=Rhizoctonia solani AG-3 TaxID=1086053 RepID=A0A074S0D9_9AGAM|nr:hypothetical protein RSOL_359440 [Rhizoctonia solani AG-3 Rhs1AP]KEP50358.1 hypothetical protein V565_081650 [Rhizoctonia solani 123E]
MMKAISSVLMLGSTALLTAAADTWGGACSLGPTSAHIIESTTTLAAGIPPPNQNGALFLWPGMSNGTGDLVQTTFESYADNSWCGANKSEWCVRASVFGWFGQRDGPAGVVKGTDAVTMKYKLQSNKMTWTQTVTIDGKVVSTLDSDSGPYMKGWGTGTECQDNCSGTVSAQKYTNTVITLDAADPNFSTTLSCSQGATATGITSEQGGKIWKIARINVPAMVN